MSASSNANAREFHNLVFQGGGVLGMCYAGALKALQEHNVMETVRRVAGTSAGSIISTLVAAGYPTDEIGDILREMDFAKFTDKGAPFSLPMYYGMYKGDAFKEWLGGLLDDMPGLTRDSTFEDLEINEHPELYVFATDLTEHRCQEFSFRATPGVRIVDAVRASMSIPMFFYAVKFPDDNPTDHLYIDGGLLLNFPLQLFDCPPFMPTRQENPYTLGFRLCDLTPNPLDVKIRDYRNLKLYIEEMFELFTKPPLDTAELNRVIILDTLNQSAVNFKITEEAKANLEQSGYNATKRFLTKGAPKLVQGVSGAGGAFQTLKYDKGTTPEERAAARKNLEIGKDICFGEQPSERVLADLKQMGFKTIINIRQANEYPRLNAEAEGVAVKGLGMDYLHFPIPALEDSLVEQFREPLLKATRPVYVHSGHAHRAGACVTSIVLNEIGETGEDAVRRAHELGMPAAPKLDAFIRDYVDAH